MQWLCIAAPMSLHPSVNHLWKASSTTYASRTALSPVASISDRRHLEQLCTTAPSTARGSIADGVLKDLPLWRTPFTVLPGCSETAHIEYAHMRCVAPHALFHPIPPS
jgi:hypothetical protein